MLPKHESNGFHLSNDSDESKESLIAPEHGETCFVPYQTFTPRLQSPNSRCSSPFRHDTFSFQPVCEERFHQQNRSVKETVYYPQSPSMTMIGTSLFSQKPRDERIENNSNKSTSNMQQRDVNGEQSQTDDFGESSFGNVSREAYKVSDSYMKRTFQNVDQENETSLHFGDEMVNLDAVTYYPTEQSFFESDKGYAGTMEDTEDSDDEVIRRRPSWRARRKEMRVE